MSKAVKDSIKSFEQVSWNHAVSEYERMKVWAQNENTPLYEYAIKRMKKLESKYPQLAK